ncbi:MAG: ABC transporter permease [Vallitaleaceae bacterium]|nr:ABC transporter permease [Vallitaleaceae bacterium]
MRVKTILYCVLQGVKNLFKNRLMSVASITTIMASLFVVSIFYTMIINLDYILEEFEHKIGIAVFFKEGTTENEILSLKKVLETRVEVYTVTYISEEEAWESFKTDYFAGKEELIQGFDEDNPLLGSASLQVLFDDITKQEELVNLLEKESIVRHVKEAKEVTQVITNMNRLITFISVSLIFILSLISLFIVSNTIRLGIALRKQEINIMRYIGAKNIMIRGPFIVEGILIGFIGSIIPIGVIWYFYNDVTSYIYKNFYLLKDFLVFVDRNIAIGQIVPVIITAGVLLGFLGSRITVSKYLKV